MTGPRPEPPTPATAARRTRLRVLVIQALANMAVSVNLVPVTGLTLPMVSMGGTSVLFTCISFGILLSVSKYIEQLSAQQAQEEQ